LIREIFAAAEGNYGVPRVHRELRDNGIVVNIKRVRRLMRRHGMAGRCVRRRVRTTIPGLDGHVIPDLVGRAFAPGPPDWAWCQDITLWGCQFGAGGVVGRATGRCPSETSPTRAA
jgi:transposase InsO family protein